MPDKTCNNCACNKVCNHDIYGFESCGNFISAEYVVEVVRCKDCEHYEDGGSSHFCNEYGGYVTANDYCSRAENKTNLKKELIND